MGIWCLGRSAKGTGQRKERESNPQGLSARPLSRRLPSPSWLVFPYQSARQDLNLRSRLPERRDHSRLVHSLFQSGRQDLNLRSRGSRPRDHSRLVHVLSPEHPAGIEPARPPWQGGRLPLHHGCLVGIPSCQRTVRPVLPVGIEPTQSRLRGGCSTC